MTSPIPTIPLVQPKKPKRSRTTLTGYEKFTKKTATVTLPKGKYELLDEATRERKEEMAQKTAAEEVNERNSLNLMVFLSHITLSKPNTTNYDNLFL